MDVTVCGLLVFSLIYRIASVMLDLQSLIHIFPPLLLKKVRIFLLKPFLNAVQKDDVQPIPDSGRKYRRAGTFRRL